MSTPNLENFDQREFAKEIRAFLKKNHISTRAWARLTGSSPMTLQRIEKLATGVSVDLVAKFQKVMRTFKPSGA